MSEVDTGMTPPNMTVLEESMSDLAPSKTAGTYLASARLQQGMSAQQVADQLKLSLRQVSAIESDQYQNLPAMVIVRGFVRSYAKLLKLDADIVVALLPKDAATVSTVEMLRPTMSTPFQESRIPSMGRMDASNRRFVVGAILLAVLAAAFFIFQKYEKQWFQFAEKSPSVATSDNAVSKAVESPASESAATSAPIVPVVKPSEPAVAVMPPVVEVQSTASQNEVSAKPVAPAVAVSTSASEVAGVVADGANQLKLRFKQDSWIQIKRSNGAILTAHLAKAGTVETYAVNDELSVKIGNAAGVEGELRGSPLDIPVSKDSNVANLTLK
jgi:cytoskeleton protein RodZ